MSGKRNPNASGSKKYQPVRRTQRKNEEHPPCAIAEDPAEGLKTKDRNPSAGGKCKNNRHNKTVPVVEEREKKRGEEDEKISVNKEQTFEDN